MTITGDMTIAQVLEIDPGIANIFMENGMHCLGCLMANGESIGEAALVRGVDVTNLTSRINAYLSAKATA